MLLGMPALLLAVAIMLLIIIFLCDLKYLQNSGVSFLFSFSSPACIGSLPSNIFTSSLACPLHLIGLLRLAFQKLCPQKVSDHSFTNSDLILLVTTILLKHRKPVACRITSPRALYRDSLPSVMKPFPLSARCGVELATNWTIFLYALFCLLHCIAVEPIKEGAMPVCLLFKNRCL